MIGYVEANHEAEVGVKYYHFDPLVAKMIFIVFPPGCENIRIRDTESYYKCPKSEVRGVGDIY